MTVPRFRMVDQEARFPGEVLIKPLRRMPPQVSMLIPRPASNGMEMMCQPHGSD